MRFRALAESRRTAVSFLAAAALVGCSNEPDVSWLQSNVDVDDFVLPSLSIAERAEIVHRYDRLDPDDVVPRGMLEDAILYFDVNQAHIPKHSYLVVVDLALYSGKDRFWLVDLTSGAVESHKVAHGDGSDPNNDGYATAFSNTPGSHMSSLGFYLTGEIYDGTHPHSMRLDGLTKDGSPNQMENTNARSRLIVVHEASYVNDANTGQQGRSNGCPALDPDIEADLVDKIYGGSLMYLAIAELNTPVGRASCGDAVCDGAETAESCADDCANMPPDTGPGDDGTDPDDMGPDPGDPEPGGCSTSGGRATWLLVFALAGLCLRQRRR
jgi:hypothetical protein